MDTSFIHFTTVAVHSDTFNDTYNQNFLNGSIFVRESNELMYIHNNFLNVFTFYRIKYWIFLINHCNSHQNSKKKKFKPNYAISLI